MYFDIWTCGRRGVQKVRKLEQHTSKGIPPQNTYQLLNNKYKTNQQSCNLASQFVSQ